LNKNVVLSGLFFWGHYTSCWFGKLYTDVELDKYV